MLKNYLMVAFRNLLRHRAYSLINILGMAVGIACCVLILLYIQDELSYDRHHKNGDRIARVVRESHVGGNSSFGNGISGAMAPALINDFPEVEHAVRMMNWGVFMRYEDKVFEQRVCISEPSILDMFTLPLIEGDPETVFKEPYSILITQEMATKFFGNQNPIGKVFTNNDRYVDNSYTVTGILKDIPDNSTVRFDFLTTTVPQRYIQGGWDLWRGSGWRPAQAYVMLREGHSVKDLEAKLPSFIEQYMGKEVQEKNTYHLQVYSRTYLYSAEDLGLPGMGGIKSVRLFSAIAFFVLLIACINFMNLSTARSAGRAREVGLRKVVGAYRIQLIGQFLGESILLSSLALLLGIGIVELALPEFNDLADKQLSLTSNSYMSLVLGLPCIAVIVGVLAGSYPALFLSGFRPVAVLKGKLGTGAKISWFRKGLVVFQFAISVLLIIGTIVVYNQLTYISSKELGFNKEQMVLLPLFYRDRSLGAKNEMVKNEFLRHPNVLKAAASHSFGALGGELRTVQTGKGLENESQIQIVGVDEDFLDTYEIELLAGRNLSKHIASDSLEAFLLNETAVKQLGWTDPVGKRFAWQEGQTMRDGHVIGVVKDFHNLSLRQKIPPIAICKRQSVFNTLSLKIGAGNTPETMAFIESKWEELIPNFPFEYNIMDEVFENIYRSETRFGQITYISSVLAIFVACLGLFGLISFIAQQRTREIGIRKTLGASAPNVVLLLSKEFIKLVLVANLISWPLAYYGLDSWLQNFEYRTNLSVMAFILSGAISLVIALATVSFQAIKSAQTNPIDALRHE